MDYRKLEMRLNESDEVTSLLKRGTAAARV
jgi:hypothetical protein